MRSQIFKKPLPYLALLIAHIIWGANFVMAKITLTEFPVMSLAFSRFFVATLLILPFLIHMKKKDIKIKFDSLPLLLLITVLMITLNLGFFYEGLKRTSAIDASVLTMLIPILSVMAGWWFLKEKVFLINLVGITLGFVGTIAIIGLPMLSKNISYTTLTGNFLIIFSNIFFIAGSVLSKKIIDKFNPVFFTTILFCLGAVTFLIPALLDLIYNPNWLSGVSILGLLGFLYITLLSSICAFFLLIWSYSKMDLTQANLFHFIEPAIAATLAVPLLGEGISFAFIIGTCLIVLGVYWGTLGKQGHHHIHHKSHRI